MAFKKRLLHSQQALFSLARIFLHPAVTPAAQSLDKIEIGQCQPVVLPFQDAQPHPLPSEICHLPAALRQPDFEVLPDLRLQRRHAAF